MHGPVNLFTHSQLHVFCINDAVGFYFYLQCDNVVTQLQCFHAAMHVIISDHNMHVASFGRDVDLHIRTHETARAGNMQYSIFVLASALVAAPSLALFPCSDDRCFRLSRDANKIPFSDLSVATLTGRCHTECTLEVYRYITALFLRTCGLLLYTDTWKES